MPWLGHVFLRETHALALFAGGDAMLLQDVGRLDGDEARPPVGERLARRLENRGAGAAAPDPAFGDRSVGADDRFRAGLGGGRGDRAHDRRQNERLPFGLQQRREFKNVREAVHQILAR